MCKQLQKLFWGFLSAFNIRVASGRVASPGEVLVVVWVVLVVAFSIIVSVFALPLLSLLLRKPPPGPPKPPPGSPKAPPEPTQGLLTQGLATTNCHPSQPVK